MRTRDATLTAVRGRGHFSVIVVGAGINGAGLFSDLALQGVDCLLVDRGDYGAGTSAAPSRLIHGGLKYLETGEFDLVAESARERNLLLRNAPHYVKPLESVVPVHSRFGGTLGAAARFFRFGRGDFERGGLVIRLGLALYDWLGRHHRVMPRHRYHSRRRSLARMPSLRADIVGTGCYYDARVTYAERLNLELVLDGVATGEGRALALNYAPVVDRDGPAVVIEDRESGGRLSVTADVVVNAGGPWIDGVNGALGQPSRYIGGSKGSHLVLDHPELLRELDGRMVYFGASDGRICLAYPFFDRVLVGSTDIPVDDADAAVCDESEIGYMLEELGKLFPGLSFPRERVIYHYVGVRPLPAVDVDDPGKVPRSHSVKVDEPAGDRPFPVLSLIGGKWTTFRSFAEEVADDVLGRLGRNRRESTRDRPIGGGRDYPASERERERMAANLGSRAGVARAGGEALLGRYGTRAFRVAEAVAGDAGDTLRTLPDYYVGEIRFLCREESVCRLADVALRRTNLGLTGRLTVAVLDEIAAIAAAELGWDERRVRDEVAASIKATEAHGTILQEAAASARAGAAGGSGAY